jgi:hypothetical protein
MFYNFRMLEINYTGDFAFILSELWESPEKEPMVSHNMSLGVFLNQTLEEIERFFSTNKINDRTLNELSIWTRKIGHILPEIAMLANLSNAINMLNPAFQWNIYREYKEQIMQNDSCYVEKVSLS